MSSGPNSIGHLDVPPFDMARKLEHFLETNEITSEAEVVGQIVNPELLQSTIDESQSRSTEAYLVMFGGTLYRELDDDSEFARSLHLDDQTLDAFLPTLDVILRDFRSRQASPESEFNIEIFMYSFVPGTKVGSDATTVVPHTDGEVDNLKRITYLTALGTPTIIYPGKFMYTDVDDTSGQPVPTFADQIAAQGIAPMPVEEGSIILTDNQTVHQAPPEEGATEPRAFIATEITQTDYFTRGATRIDDTFVALKGLGRHGS